MFRRAASSLPADFEFPEDLAGLGYFINENDQIRMIDDPNQAFHFFISKNDRYVERQREAMDACIRKIVQERVFALGFKSTRLPNNDVPLNLPPLIPPNEPHVPVWYSDNLETCKRVYVYIGETDKDIGIVSGRVINQEGIEEGSILKFIKLAQHSSSGEELSEDLKPGIIIANPGQCLWSFRAGRALTWKSWYAAQRESAVDPPYELNRLNTLTHYSNTKEHVTDVLTDLVCMLEQNPEVYIVAAGNAAADAYEAIRWCECFGDCNFQGMAMLPPVLWQDDFDMSNDIEAGIGRFFGGRARAYIVSPEPTGTPLPGRAKMRCNIYSSGEDTYVEQSMCKASKSIVEYFRLLSMFPDYAELPQDDVDDSVHEDTSWAISAPAENKEIGEAVGKSGEDTQECNGVEDFARLAVTQKLSSSVVNEEAGGKTSDSSMARDWKDKIVPVSPQVKSPVLPAVPGDGCNEHDHDQSTVPMGGPNAVEEYEQSLSNSQSTEKIIGNGDALMPYDVATVEGSALSVGQNSASVESQPPTPQLPPAPHTTPNVTSPVRLSPFDRAGSNGADMVGQNSTNTASSLEQVSNVLLRRVSVDQENVGGDDSPASDHGTSQAEASILVDHQDGSDPDTGAEGDDEASDANTGSTLTATEDNE